MLQYVCRGVLLVASANSMEVGVLGVVQSGEPAIWQQWNQIDAARAELPLSANHQDTFPVGFAFDTGITMQLPWGKLIFILLHTYITSCLSHYWRSRLIHH